MGEGALKIGRTDLFDSVATGQGVSKGQVLARQHGMGVWEVAFTVCVA